MKRIMVLMLGLLAAPVLVSAQGIEIGVDAGLSITSYGDVGGFSQDGDTEFDIPSHLMRIGVPAGEQIIVETRLGLGYGKSGDNSSTVIEILPGVNFLLGEMFYARGEVGLWRGSFDNGTTSNSATQYAFGGAAGIRKPAGMAVFRVEAGATRWMENADDGLLSETIFSLLFGVSAVVN